MSRVAKKPVELPKGVEININGQAVTVKGSKGSLSRDIHTSVGVTQEDNVVSFAPKDGSKAAMALTGTTRALVNNMVIGVTEGFEKKLELVGVGYRAQAQGQKLNLTLGFSHPVDYAVPEGITVETPSQTEVVVRGTDKQQVGQVAAEIRAYRPPEPYKGKGVKYADEIIVRKVSVWTRKHHDCVARERSAPGSANWARSVCVSTGRRATSMRRLSMARATRCWQVPRRWTENYART